MRTDEQQPATENATPPEKATTSEKDATRDNAEAAPKTRSARLRDLAKAMTTSRVLRDRSVRAALFAFGLSRLIVLVIFVLVGLMKTAPDEFPGHFDAYVSLDKAPVARVLRHEVLTADVNWYVGIAEHGYEQIPFNNDVPRNWAFFPLFPLLLRLASYVTGEFVLTGMAFSHLCFLLALFLLHRLSLLFGLNADDADRSLFYLAFFPTSYFFSIPLPESLFLMLTVASFYFGKSERWWLAGLCGAFASATRTTGVLLLPALAVLYWEMYRPLPNIRALRKDGLALLLIPTGLLAFMIYLHRVTGNALAFKGAMAAWGRKAGFFFSPLVEYLSHPGEILAHWDFRLWNFVAVVIALACGIALLKRRQFALATYALLAVLVALSSALLQSQARYAMVVFPVYLVLGTLGRRRTFDQLIRVLFLVLFALMTALFAAHFTVALS
ncbi:MAG TPA: mannosyltransferase family protein [Pyrinomonadaceae bacterium]|nr:mannosyltransferase family protein [Pyrinomonadaceae bacterium]